MVRPRRRVAPALSGREDFELRFCDALAIAVNVGESVVTVAYAHEDQDAFWPLCDGFVLSRREHYVGQVDDGFLQSRIGVDGVLPYLVGVGCQVNLAVEISVEDARAFVVEVEDRLVVVFVFEKRLVCTDYFGVLPEPRPDPATEVDDALYALGGKEGVAQDLFRFLPDAVDAARPLYEPDDGPRQVVVNDDVAVLEVLAFAQYVGGDEDSKFLFRFVPARSLVAIGAESPCKEGGVGGVSCDASRFAGRGA